MHVFEVKIPPVILSSWERPVKKEAERIFQEAIKTACRIHNIEPNLPISITTHDLNVPYIYLEWDVLIGENETYHFNEGGLHEEIVNQLKNSPIKNFPVMWMAMIQIVMYKSGNIHCVWQSFRL